MECPKCGTRLKGGKKFCGECATELPEEFMKRVDQEFNQEREEILTPVTDKNRQSFSTPPIMDMDENRKAEDISYETGDSRKKEYKKLLLAVFADRVATADEYKLLAEKRERLALSKEDVEALHHDVGRELGFQIHDEGDLLADIIFETNENNVHFAGNMNSLEVRLTNTSGNDIDKVVIRGHLKNLKLTEQNQISGIRSGQSHLTYMQFDAPRAGNAFIEIAIEYDDLEGKPLVYKTNMSVSIFDKTENQAANINIQNIIKAEGGSAQAGDYEGMMNFQNLFGRKEEPKLSSYSEGEKRWVRRCIFFDKHETERKRESLIINKKLSEGEAKLMEGIDTKEECEQIFALRKGDPQTVGEKSRELLNEALKCFKNIRERDPSHEGALQRVKKIRALSSEVGLILEEIDRWKHQTGKSGGGESRIHGEPQSKIQTQPAIRVGSACLTMNEPLKRVYLYSKERIALGRDSGMDMVLRLIPYQPKEQYPDNWKKSTQISGKHAEIINKGGNFIIRDTGKDNAGSSNGTFLDGRKIRPMEECPLNDDMRINIARVLDLQCHFLGNNKKKDSVGDTMSSCFTVFGDRTNSCFGVDKQASVDAIKLKRRNNFGDGEEYLILIREVSLGRSRSNGISIESETVSDIHARLFYRDDQYWIEDLNSRHGTWVNGIKLSAGTETKLGMQSQITLGDTVFQFNGFE